MKRDRDAELSNAELLAIVDIAREFQGSVKDRRTMMERKYPDFASRYPFLFDMVCQDDFDMNRFKYMLEMREKVTARNMSHYDASKEIGQKMFDIYVKDKVKK